MRVWFYCGSKEEVATHTQAESRKVDSSCCWRFPGWLARRSIRGDNGGRRRTSAAPRGWQPPFPDGRQAAAADPFPYRPARARRRCRGGPRSTINRCEGPGASSDAHADLVSGAAMTCTPTAKSRVPDCSITSTNNQTARPSGATPVASSHGPAAANGAIVADTADGRLSCTGVTRAASEVAACPSGIGQESCSGVDAVMAAFRAGSKVTRALVVELIEGKKTGTRNPSRRGPRGCHEARVSSAAQLFLAPDRFAVCRSRHCH